MRNCTDITVILDRSGSMSSCKSAMEEALNGFLADQKSLASEALFSLVKFDDHYEKAISGMPVKDVAQITIEPRGSTALLDAIGRTIDDTGQRLSNMREEDRPNKVIIVIVTDGYENASRVYHKNRIFDMIAHQRDRYAWTFMFLGADQDAIASATALGISAGNALGLSSAQGAQGPRGAIYMARSMSLGIKKLREGAELTSGSLLKCCATPEDTDNEYAKEYGSSGNVKKSAKV